MIIEWHKPESYVRGGDSGSELVMGVNKDTVSSPDIGPKFNDVPDRRRCISFKYIPESRERDRCMSNLGLALPATVAHCGVGVIEPFSFGFLLKLLFLLELNLDT